MEGLDEGQQDPKVEAQIHCVSPTIHEEEEGDAGDDDDDDHEMHKAHHMHWKKDSLHVDIGVTSDNAAASL
jgi:hypothetical protein